MNDFPCKCGHLENVHPPNVNIRVALDSPMNSYYVVCDGCFLENRIRGIKQLGTINCNHYVSDNLKYLEQLYESRSVL